MAIDALRLPHWAQFGGPFGRIYRGGRWFWSWTPVYDRGWKFGIGHRMGGFYLVEFGPVRAGRTRR